MAAVVRDGHHTPTTSIPTHSTFTNPDEWPKLKRRFKQCRSVSGLAAEEEPRPVSTLLCSLGEDADNILTSKNIGEDDRKKYDSMSNVSRESSTAWGTWERSVQSS